MAQYDKGTKKNWYYTHFLAKILLLYPFFGAKLDIMSTFQDKMSSQLDFTSSTVPSCFFSGGWLPSWHPIPDLAQC